MALVVFLCLAWGFNQPAIKLAIPRRAAADPVRASARASALLIVLGMMRLRGLPMLRATARSRPASSPACCSASSSC